MLESGARLAHLSERERRRRRRGVACTVLPVPGARDGTRTPGGFTDVRQPAVVEDASAVEVETSEPGTDDPGVVGRGTGDGRRRRPGRSLLRLRPSLGDAPVHGQLGVEQVELGLVRRHVVLRIGNQRFDVGGRPAEGLIDSADKLHVARAQDLDDAVAAIGPDDRLQRTG